MKIILNKRLFNIKQLFSFVPPAGALSMKGYGYGIQ